MIKRVALYARVSTDKQTCENQLTELRAITERMGCMIVQEFIDEGISGVKARRPALDLMMKMAMQRKFDMVMCWSIDRLGRSLQNLIELLNQLESVKIDLFFHQQAIDTSTPMGKMMFSILGALGVYERELIRERVIVGLQTAKSRGVKLIAQFVFHPERVIKKLPKGDFCDYKSVSLMALIDPALTASSKAS